MNAVKRFLAIAGINVAAAMIHYYVLIDILIGLDEIAMDFDAVSVIITMVFSLLVALIVGKGVIEKTVFFLSGWFILTFSFFATLIINVMITFWDW